MKELVEVIDQIDADISMILDERHVRSLNSEDMQKLAELDRERSNRITALLELIRNAK